MKFRIVIEAEVSEAHLAKHGLTAERVHADMEDLTRDLVQSGDVSATTITVQIGDETFTSTASSPPVRVAA